MKSTVPILVVVGFLVMLGCGRTNTATIPGTSTGERKVSGEISYRARIALPDSAIAIVELREGSEDDSPLLAEQRIPLAGLQVPVPFTLVYNRAVLSANRTTHFRAGISVAGSIKWISEAVALQGGPEDAELGTVMVAPVRPVAFTSPYLCGDEPVEFGVVGDKAILRVAGDSYAMRPSVSASGARFEAENDPTTIFWSKGEQASLTLRGLNYPSCQKVGSVAKEDVPDGIVGETWVVEDMQPGGIIDRSRITIQFGKNGRAAGMASCNSYSASYTLDADSLTFGLAASTMKACIPSLMEQERRFLDGLAAVEGYAIDDTGALTLNGKNGQKIVLRKAVP